MIEDASRLGKITEWKHLTEHVLPALAQEHHWPLRLDHCFKRVTLDYAFRDVWYRHLQKPAELHLKGDALIRALACAREIAEAGEPILRLRNQESLAFRGKRRLAAQL